MWGLLVWGSSQCVAYGCSAAARRKLRAARSGCEAAARLSPSSAWKKEACSGCEALAAVAAVASSASVQQPIASSVRRSLECHGTRHVRHARGWYVHDVRTVVSRRGKLPCASGSCSTEAPGRACQLRSALHERVAQPLPGRGCGGLQGDRPLVVLQRGVELATGRKTVATLQGRRGHLCPVLPASAHRWRERSVAARALSWRGVWDEI